MTAPSFVAAVTSQASAATSTFQIPTGGQAGDLLLMFGTQKGVAAKEPAAITSGWTLEQSWIDNGNYHGVWWKPWNSDTGATFENLQGGHWTCIIYRNARTTGATPFGDVQHATGSNSQNGQPGPIPSATVTAAGSLLIGYSAPLRLGSATIEGMTVRATATNQNGATTDNHISHVVADEGHVAAIGPSGTRAVTVDSGSVTSGTWTNLALVLFQKNQPPNAPTLSFPAVVNVNATTRFPWQFSDADAGDSQSAAEVQRWVLDASGTRVGAATVVSVGNPNQFWDAPAGTFTAGKRYEGQVRTADAQGTWGPWSPSSFWDANNPPPGPTLTDPVSGQVIATSSYTGAISAASLTQSEWRLYADNAGAIGTTQVQPAVVKSTGDIRSHTWTGLQNNVPVWWWVRSFDGGLWSQPVTARTTVSFTAPPVPTVTVAAANAQGAVTISYANPVPQAGEPAVAYNDVFVRAVDSADQYRPYSDSGTRIAKEKPLNGVLIDHAAASGVVYEYRVVAHGTNGTVAVSEWVSIDPAAEPTIYYGGAY